MKMLKTRLSTVFAVCLIFGLVGCDTITPQEIINAQTICKEHKGILGLNSHPLISHLYAVCVDGHVEGVKETAN